MHSYPNTRLCIGWFLSAKKLIFIYIYSLDITGEPHLAAKIVSELENFLSTDAGRNAPAPNTMNRHGRTLAAMGLVDLELSLLHLVLQPIAQALFPEWIGEHLDHRYDQVLYILFIFTI